MDSDTQPSQETDVMSLETQENSQDEYMSKEDKRVLQVLMEKLPNNQALSIGSEILGIKKNLIYKQTID